jgi:hypothetical protein
MTLRQIWRRLTSTRYARVLESDLAHARAELDRLRTENRRLVDSILNTAGIPPLATISADALPSSHLALTPGPDAPASGPVPPPPRTPGARVAIGGAAGNKSAIAIAPMRRRSWHQITRMLEFESARRAVAGDK